MVQITRSRDVATQGGLVLLNTTSFTSSAQIDITSVFSSTYQNYKMYINLTDASTINGMRYGLLSGATMANSSYYSEQVGRNQSGGGHDLAQSNAAYWDLFDYTYGNASSAEISMIAPYLATKTTALLFTHGYNNSNFIGRAGSGLHNVASSYDGIRFYPNGGTVTGTVKIYGLK